MREKIWLALRECPGVRRLQSVPGLRGVMTNLSYLLLPSYSQRTVKVQSGPGRGLLLTVNPRWETALWRGSYEATVQSILMARLGPGKTFYDIGGGPGFYALLAANAGARVFVFEPDSYNAKCIQSNAYANRLASRIDVIPTAVSWHTGQALIETAPQRTGHGNAHLVINHFRSQTLTEIRCTTLDDFVASHPAPQVVKIDVEGAESDVLKGADGLFVGVRPYLVCEIHDEANSVFIQSWLSGKNYTFRWLSGTDSFPRHFVASPA